jgi:hypothetical protein
MVQRGTLFIGWQKGLYVPNDGWHAYRIDPYLSPNWLGFRWSRYPTNWLIGIPFWLPAILAALLAWVCWRRGKPPVGKFCRQCGYDLRASPDRCPECGLPNPGVV